MGYYKDRRAYLGWSDIAMVVLVGFKEGDVATVPLHFGGDGDYNAYIVEDKETEIPEHYVLKNEFYHWLKIYDDETLRQEFHADKIEVYRAGDYTALIKLINEKE